MRSREFDITLYVLRKLCEKFGTLGWYRAQDTAVKIRHKKIEAVLKKELADILDKYRKIKYEKKICPSDKRIWTLWWEGQELAPELIKLCFASMRKNKVEYALTIIDRNNYGDYIELPEHIIDKVKSGKITITHLSDIIRMALLEKYGGIWLDAAVMLLDRADDSWEEYPYFTAKQKAQKSHIVSQSRWTGSFIVGENNFPFYKFMLECFCKYWERHDEMIDYFLIDYLTDIAYSELGFYKNALDALPLNNTNMYNAEKYMNREFAPDKFAELTRDTVLLKFQRRNTYIKEYKGKETLYGYLYNRYAEL